MIWLVGLENLHVSDTIVDAVDFRTDKGYQIVKSFHWVEKLW